MKASLIAIGTELTTGQIINKNGAFISQKLQKFGVVVINQIVVPDDKAEIIKALNYCKSADLIFVTGGLGPTSDDFTRDVIAQWLSLSLVFNEKSWSHVQDRLISRGFTVKDIQKQQCFFPEGSEILENSQGTANGFALNAENKRIFILPGPPKEISAIWQNSIDPWLLEKTKHIDHLVTKSWDTIGMGESDVAVIVEAQLLNRKPSLQMDLGYRVHLPYVEVKLTYPISMHYTCDLYVKKLDSALEKITVLKDFQDAADLFSKKMSSLGEKTEFAIYDYVTNGFLHHRLSSILKNHKNWAFQQSSDARDADFFKDENNFLALLPQNGDNTESDNFFCLVISCFDGKFMQKIIEAPMKSLLMKERRLQYFAEMALIGFVLK